MSTCFTASKFTQTCGAVQVVQPEAVVRREPGTACEIHYTQSAAPDLASSTKFGMHVYSSSGYSSSGSMVSSTFKRLL
jgi:hypothetical protein